MGLLDEIVACPKVNRCWGDRCPIAYGPVAIRCRKQQPKVMIVTEQANRRRNSVNTPWNPSRLMVDYLSAIKRGERTGLANKIDTIFEGAFLADLDAREGSFNEFYWTLFIKCPGNFRRKGKYGTGPLNVKACADKWLLAEVLHFKPKLIVSFGAPASTWILPKTGYGERWTERVWEEFKWIITGQGVPDANINGLTIKLIVALHPSGANPLALPFNEKIGKLVRATFYRL